MGLNIKEIENHYGVSYINFYDIPGRDHVHVFYQPNPNLDLGHSHYMGVILKTIDLEGTQEAYLCNAKTIEDALYNAVKVGDEFIVSRYRHDYKELGGAMIDGGLDYARYNPNFPVTHVMRIVDGKEVFEERNHGDQAT